MTADTNTTPGAATELPVPPSAPLTKRLISDAAILRMRAENQTLDVIAEAAGLSRSTVSAWLRHPRQAERLKQEIQLVRLERQTEKREQEAKEKQARSAKRRAREQAKPPEPEPEFNSAVESWGAHVDRMAKVGVRGRVLTGRRGPITWG